MTTLEETQTDRARLHKIGFSVHFADMFVGHVDVDKVESLVLARNCPLQLAARIAAYDDIPSLTIQWLTEGNTDN